MRHRALVPVRQKPEDERRTRIYTQLMPRISLATPLASLLFAWIFAACASTPVEPPPPEVRLEQSGGDVHVTIGGEAFTSFRTRAIPKPFLYPLLAPGGLAVTRGFPIDPGPADATDHPHHVSLWFGHGDVDGHDFWHQAATVHVRTIALSTEENAILSTHEWVAGERVVAVEERKMTFFAGHEARWIDFELKIAPTSRGLTFGDTKEGTFALRLAPSLRVEGEVAAGHLFDSQGRENGEVWGERARWVATSGMIGESPVTVAVLDHPRNPRHPTWWHARNYGLLAANPFGKRSFGDNSIGEGELTIEEPVTFRYRVWLTNRRVERFIIDGVWTAYARSGRPL